MDKTTANRPLTIWKKSEISLLNYQKYISRKSEKFELTIIDLLYISNFKGGNATINEEERGLNLKLKIYSEKIEKIDNVFSNKTLKNLNGKNLANLCNYLIDFIQLSKNTATAIDGFKSSFLSALLHSYFPDLVPILDRRLLINLNLVQASDLQKSGQVSKIESFYPNLVCRIHALCKETGRTVRQIDEEYFIRKLPNWANRRVAVLHP